MAIAGDGKPGGVCVAIGQESGGGEEGEKNEEKRRGSGLGALDYGRGSPAKIRAGVLLQR